MLPNILSDDLCSLNPEVERLSLVCEMHINKDGIMQGYRFYNAVIKSHKRLTYQNATKLLDKLDNKTEQTDIEESLTTLKNLYIYLNYQRTIRDAIQFETKEVKFNIKKNSITYSLESRTVAHKIIEECMCLANNAAGYFITRKLKSKGIYRIHKAPDEDKLTSLRTLLNNLNIDIEKVSHEGTINYNLVAQYISTHPNADVIQTLLLRTLNQAIYSTENIGHFGLQLDQYVHFTSPIRRYTDLITHRLIKQQLGDASIQESSQAFLVEAAEHCSMTEKRADDATYDLQNYLICKILSEDDSNKITTGIISTISKFGCYVTLHNLPVDGMLELDKNQYAIDLDKLEILQLNTNKVYHIADQVNIEILVVDQDKLRINLKLID